MQQKEKLLQCTNSPIPHVRCRLIVRVFALLAGSAILAANATDTSAPTAAPVKDPYKDSYANYTPPFVPAINANKNNWASIYAFCKKTDEEMKLSTEPSFFTLNLV